MRNFFIIKFIFSFIIILLFTSACEKEEKTTEIDQITKECSGLRRIGSASLDLAYVAAGKFDAYWERNLNLWDMAAGVLLVTEAGGKVTEPSGKPWSLKSKDILVSNSILHDEIQQKLVILK